MIRPRRRIGMIVATVALAATIGAACGVNDGGGAEVINPGLGLDDTAPTTSTSTTSTTSTTIATQSTVGPPPTSATPTTGVQTESVQLWFISGNVLNPITIPLTYPATLDQVVVALQRGSAGLGPAASFWRTAVPTSPRLVARDDEDGTATVDLPSTFFSNIPGADQVRAIGQIVLTLTMRPGIGGVTFTMSGEPTAVVLGNGEQSAKKQVVSRADYRVLTVSEPETSTSTSTSVATATTIETTVATPVTVAPSVAEATPSTVVG